MNKLKAIICMALLAITSVSYAQQPTEGDAIDMGVSVMWSSKNIGSQEVTEIGGQYAYGCLEEGTVDKNLYKFLGCPVLCSKF